jgi:hypothetical protein
MNSAISVMNLVLNSKVDGEEVQNLKTVSKMTKPTSLPTEGAHGHLRPAAHTYTPFQSGCYPLLPFGFKIVEALLFAPDIPLALRSNLA